MKEAYISFEVQLTSGSVNPTLNGERILYTAEAVRSPLISMGGEVGEVPKKVSQQSPRVESLPVEAGVKPVPVASEGVLSELNTPIYDSGYEVRMEEADVRPEGSGPYEFLYTQSPELIQNPKLRGFVVDKFRSKPVNELTVDKLKDLYKELTSIRAGEDISPQEKENLASDSHPYGDAIVTELQKRLEGTNESVEDFLASTINPDSDEGRPLRPGTPAPRPGGSRGGRAGGPPTGGTPPSDGEGEPLRDEGETAKRVRIFRLLQQDDVKEVLRQDNPNLDIESTPVENVRNLLHEIERIDPLGERGTNIMLARIIANPFLRTAEGEEIIPMSIETRRVLFERLVENIIGIPDLTPKAAYDLGFYMGNELDSLKAVARTSDLLGREFYNYIEQLIFARKIMHGLALSLSSPDEYKQYIAKGLKNAGLNLVYNDVAGVSEVFNLFEKANLDKVAQVKKWLDDGDMKDIDAGVEEVIQKMRESELLKKGERVLTKWEVERAIRFAKIYGGGLQRSSIYKSYGNIPEGDARSASLAEAEFIARGLNHAKMIGARWFIYNSGPKELLEMQLHQLEHDGAILQENGSVARNPYTDEAESKYANIAGTSTWNNIINYMGQADVMSHERLAKLLFLSEIKFRVTDSKGEYQKTNLADYMMRMRNRFLAYKDESRGEVFQHSGKEEFLEDDYHDAIREAVYGQRLYLSVLANQKDNLSEDMVRAVWMKRAMLNPSSVVSMLPEEMLGLSHRMDKVIKIRDEIASARVKERSREPLLVSEHKALREEASYAEDIRILETWEALKSKLWIAEQERVREDGEELKQYSDALTKKEKGELLDESETERLDKIIGDYESKQKQEARQMRKFYLTEQERVGRLGSEEEIELSELRAEAALGNYNELQIQEYCDRFASAGEKLDEKPKQKELLKKIIKNGYTRGAERLTYSVTPYTLAIDDAPAAAWVKTGEGFSGLADEDVYRLIGSDQVAVQESWGAIMDVSSSPTENAIDKFAKGVKGIGNTISYPYIRGITESMAVGYLHFTAAHGDSEFIEGLMKEMGKPRSAIEKHYRKSFMAMNSAQRRAWIDRYAQSGAGADNLTSKDSFGHTFIERMYDKSHARRRDLFRKWLINYLEYMIAAAVTGLPDVFVPELRKGA